MSFVEHPLKIQSAIKADENKTRLDLLPLRPLQDVGDILTLGATKYDAHNWRKGMKWSRFYAATLRHLFAWWQGQDLDPESGKSHLAHAACNILFLLEYTYSHKELDDRYIEEN